MYQNEHDLTAKTKHNFALQYERKINLVSEDIFISQNGYVVKRTDGFTIVKLAKHCKCHILIHQKSINATLVISYLFCLNT